MESWEIARHGGDQDHDEEFWYTRAMRRCCSREVAVLGGYDSSARVVAG